MQNYLEFLSGTFDQITEIGSGGGGTIYKARHKRLDKDVVLKKIHKKQLKNINRRGELDILKNLKHNYIPQIIDFMEYGDEVFTVMEYIPGQSFAQLLEQGYRFAQKDVVKWMRQLCEVVDYLHSRKSPIIHCDIKPGNVMLTPQGDICLIDFNISGVKTEEGIASIGYSNGYAPVEQFAVVARRIEKSVQERAQAAVSAIRPVNPASDGTEILARYAADGTEILPGHGTEGTEILARYAADGTEILPGHGTDGTEIVARYAADGTEILPGHGTEGTEILAQYAADGTEILPGHGTDGTEIVARYAADGTEILARYAADGTEILPGYGTDGTEILARYATDGTEILPGHGTDGTEILARYAADGTEILSGSGAGSIGTAGAARGNAPVGYQYTGTGGSMGAAASSVLTGGRSLIRSMSNEDWDAAKRIEASVGSSLMIDERTDIYSVGATLYHILCGRRPQPFYCVQIPVKQANENVSDSVAYVIEKAMALNPADRFKNSSQLLKTVRNIGTVDKRYKALSRSQLAAAFITGALTVASALSVSFGISTMSREKQDLYQFYIEEMEEARKDKDFDAVAADFEKAAALMEGEGEAYYEMGMAYYEQRRYQEGIDFLSQNVYTNTDLSLEEGYGRFYFITASCYFELEDYNSAISYYERAVIRQSDEMAYYRDYVVALARNGQIEKAGQVLQEASRKGISADIMSLLKGEIALIQNDYQECELELLECLAATEDHYIRLRAYSKLDDAYRLTYQDAEQYDIRIALLTEALEILPTGYQVTLIERLAQVYIDYSDIGDRNFCCESAIALFERMENLGYATFTSRLNIGILYEKMEKYEEAMAHLAAMVESYPSNYRIYKRMSFVELDIQAERAREERDYHTFDEYYQQAAVLYQSYEGPGDMEMLSLEELYADVVENGWLEG